MNRELVTKSELIHEQTVEEYRRFIRVRTFGMEKVQKRLIGEVTWGILLSQSLRLHSHSPLGGSDDEAVVVSD